MALKLRSKEECLFDQVSLGEIMLRFDPGEGRIHTARRFSVSEGGGEYNVARALRRGFGLRTAVISAIARNPLGELLEGFVLEGGVDTRYIRWMEYDGIGRTVRNGLNFTERGFGIRGALSCVDRGHSAASRLRADDFDWEEIFGKAGVRWFHTGGIFAALSETTPDVVIAAMKAARKHGTVISYDLNYRPSLWKAVGGSSKAQDVNREIARYVDVMIGNEEDFTACLGFEVEGVDKNLTRLESASFRKMIQKAAAAYPNFKAVATTLRGVITATRNDWGAICWTDGKFYEATHRPGLEILDRVGGGDGFASGFIYGMMETGDPKQAVELGAAHGALAMTTPGDTSMARLSEIRKVAAGGGARVVR
ncbi:MAG TPA: sugar kinase [bacterium]|nr:sugar kinase [bacterium]